MLVENIIDGNGNLILMRDNGTFESHNIQGMIVPVKCNHCGKAYDLTAATVNHRFADCDQFTTPCCGYKFADTRQWKSFPDYKPLNEKK